MRFILALLCCLATNLIWAQTPVLRPNPITIDLANPKAGKSDLPKADKKKWKEVQKQKRKELKQLNKYYDFKLDSAQLADYQKHKELQTTDRPNLKSLAKDQLLAQKIPLDLPDSVDVTQLNDSSYVAKLSPDVQEKIQSQVGLSEYTELSPDSVRQLKTLMVDSLSSAGDSTSGYAQTQQKEMMGQVTNDALEAQGQEQLSNYGPTSELGAYKQDEQMMFSSYDEMIASDRYQELMSSMPGKKAEIESPIATPNFDQSNLPMAESVFAGHEQKLATAMDTKQIIRKKPTLKELLAEFFSQDMDDVQQKTVIQRFSLTGQIQLSNYDPLFIDYSPSIAFALTGKTRIGTGVTGRIKIGDGEDDKDNLFGYRGFMEYDILKNIYLHGEYERTGLMVTDPLSDLETRVWTDRWLLGLGTDIKLPGILNGTLIILYNFDDDLASSPNPRRFQVRYGVKLN